MSFVHKLLLLAAWLLACAGPAGASVGMAELPANVTSGPVTVFYPAAAEPRTERRAEFRLDVALDAAPVPGNRRLIVISHGSPASPWVYFDLARTLVEAGFTVVFPEHFADNYKDDSDPGPPSWRRRPQEVSRAIDRIRDETRFSVFLDLAQVGMYGMSAGGHTALVLAGGRWSPARLRWHCQVNLESDFHACTGPSIWLTGGIFDDVKKTVIRIVNDHKYDDASWYQYRDQRITAIVAGVPFAADFDPDTLKFPSVALAIISARADRWLVPRFHSGLVLENCRVCEHLADLTTGGHGALLSPLPAERSKGISALIGDPPGFDRDTEVPRLNQAITAFFKRKLLAAGHAPGPNMLSGLP